MITHLNNNGYTLVELLITLTVMGLLIGVIANFSMQALSRSTIESTRATLLGESQITMDRVISDIRLSAGADQNNRWLDSNNPNGGLAWGSNASVLLLATAAEDSADNIIFADPSKYVSAKNNVIYFVKDKTLYKRTLAAPVTGNSAKTTCPKAVATAACPADRELLHNVTNFSIKYYNGDQQEVTPTDARSVELRVQTSTKRFSEEIKSDYTTRAVFRND